MKQKFENVNFETGEIEEFETSVDLTLLEEYNEWVTERKLFPPQSTPREYAEYVEAKLLKENVSKAIAIIEKYSFIESIPMPILDKVIRILRNEEDGSE